jgi:hypothetical protein
MKKIDDRHYLSDEGKVFQNKFSNDILGWGICLGNNDSIDNYIEIDCPEEYKGNRDYDNTVTLNEEMTL